MDLKYGLYNGIGGAISGSSDLAVRVKRDQDDQFFDFNDSTFKAAGHVTMDQVMSEIDAVNIPGEYEHNLTIAAWDDGLYSIYYVYTGSVIIPFTDSESRLVWDGQEATPAQVAGAIFGTTIDGTIDMAEVMKILLAVAPGKKLTKSGSTYTYQDQAGNIMLTITWTPTEAAAVIT